MSRLMPGSPEASKHVYLFSEVELVEARVGGDWDAVRGLLGGKGANLADMAGSAGRTRWGWTWRR